MRNVVGGVEDTGLSFKLTPPPGAAGLGGGSTPTLTPPKALLMNQAGGGAAGSCRTAVGLGWQGGVGSCLWQANMFVPMPQLLQRAACPAAARRSTDRAALHTLICAQQHPCCPLLGRSAR